MGTVENSAMPLVFFAASAPGFDNATCTGFFNSSLYALGLLSGQAEVDPTAAAPTRVSRSRTRRSPAVRP
jgi:hypothetical protein